MVSHCFLTVVSYKSGDLGFYGCLFKNSIIWVNEIVTKVENAKENKDKEVLVTVLKQHAEKIS